MNTIGGRSIRGRRRDLKNKRMDIKQCVTTEYLVNNKIRQGVNYLGHRYYNAEVRFSTPGASLISPPS